MFYINLRRYTVEDDRKAGGKENPYASRGCEKAPAVVFAVFPALIQDIKEKGTEGQYGDSGCPGECSKKGAD